MKTPEQPESKGEPEPKFIFDLFFSPHATEEDFGGLQEVFDRSDIYIPEIAGSNQKIERMIKSVADGTVESGKEAFDEYDVVKDDPVLKLIQGSHKAIMVADIPEDHPLEKKMDAEIYLKIMASHREFLQGNFDVAITHRQEAAQEELLYHKERETHVRTQLGNRLPGLLREYPELNDKLKKKGHLQVLLSIGSMHTALSHEMKRSGHQVRRIFSKPLLSFDFGSELLRRLYFGKKVDEGLVAKSLIEQCVIGNIFRLTDDSDKAIRWTRRMLSPLTVRDIKDISENVGHGKGRIADLIGELAARDITIPKTEEELDAALKKKR